MTPIDRIDGRPLEIMAVYGTRPEAIKVAPLVKALEADPRFRVRVVVTGQHREMLDQVHEVFGIRPDVDLDVHAPGQTLLDISHRVLRDLDPVLQEFAPDGVLVQGDTTTTLVGALAAFYAGIPVFHAEAGLRTGERHDPFPEEMNRRLTSQLAALHLAPTESARENLRRDRIAEDTIVVTGNSVIDALLHTVEGHPGVEDPMLAAQFATGRPVVLVTAHRRESWGAPMRRIAAALARLADMHPEHDFVFPMHRNPLVREAVIPAVADRPNVLLIDALPYPDFCVLLQRSRIVLTDSGGVQEEAPALGKPVLVMRETTERPEAIAAGTAQLIGTDEQAIVDAVTALLEEGDEYRRMAQSVNPYGDGFAARRTVTAIARHFGLTSEIDEFDAA